MIFSHVLPRERGKDEKRTIPSRAVSSSSVPEPHPSPIPSTTVCAQCACGSNNLNSPEIAL